MITLKSYCWTAVFPQYNVLTIKIRYEAFVTTKYKCGTSYNQNEELVSNNVELISPIKNMYHCSFESINFRYDFNQAYTSGLTERD